MADNGDEIERHLENCEIWAEIACNYSTCFFAAMHSRAKLEEMEAARADKWTQRLKEIYDNDNKQR